MVSKTVAFNELGYEYKSTRGVWSAEKADSVLMTIWQREIRWLPGMNGGTLYVDMEEIHPPGSSKRDHLINNPRLKKRREYLDKAIQEYDSNVDVVVLLGPVGNDKGESVAWKDYEQDNRSWRVARVDPGTNFFRMEAKRKAAR